MHTINKRLKHIEFDPNYVELIICGKKPHSLCFRTSICRIHCIDQSKTFTLLLKYKIIDFDTLSHVHVYRIEYVSYRQGPYRIRIDTADDRIVPALYHTAKALPIHLEETTLNYDILSEFKVGLLGDWGISIIYYLVNSISQFLCLHARKLTVSNNC